MNLQDAKRANVPFTAIKGLRVVVAEDDPAMRDLLVERLSFDGAIVEEVGSGLALFDRLRAWYWTGDEPDLLVSDIRMPGMDGLSLLEALRARGYDLPVILITAFGDPDLHARARELGAASVIDKPFDIDDLRIAVAHFAGRL